MLVYIEGKLTHRKWTDKENKDHYITEIQVETMRILEKGKALLMVVLQVTVLKAALWKKTHLQSRQVKTICHSDH